MGDGLSVAVKTLKYNTLYSAGTAVEFVPKRTDVPYSDTSIGLVYDDKTF